MKKEVGAPAPLAEAYVEFIDKPYEGLFGGSVQARVVQEIVADPFRDYRPMDIQRLIEKSAPSVQKALRELVALRFLELISTEPQHPTFKVVDSKRLVALTLLSYAIADDRDKTDSMDHAIAHYCATILGEKLRPSAFAQITQYQYDDLTIVTGVTVQRKDARAGDDYISVASSGV